MSGRYDPQTIEAKWQQRWRDTNLYYTAELDTKPAFYCLDFFPYPSGDGLSVGHCRNYIPTDVISRYKRMRGFNVLHPMGWDAFGLPAENEAIRRAVHPRDSTARYAANYKRQLNLIGTSYDWSREINSSHPDYYRWTQWFFLLLYQRGLAYRAPASVWWCPSCNTTLANEEVESGACWRCGTLVTKRDLAQWFFRITAYADRLLADLAAIDWPERIKVMQANWIGRSEGTEIVFRAENGADIPVFTTRPDTVYGVTFMVLAPEHPLVEELTAPERQAEVRAYVEMARRETEIERLVVEREKTGVPIGAYTINPLNNERVPIWTADYVLLTYGTGAVMAVPGHDQRDYQFARRFGLPVRVVIAPPGWGGEELAQAYVEEGTMVNSGPFDGLPSREGMERVSDYLEAEGWGQRKVNYRMRDWLVSRQRYWGAPIPIIHCQSCGEVPVPEEDLPVLLPDIADFQPTGTGRSPLAKVPSFVNTTCPQCGGPAQRETDTMSGFACSSWYFLRFASPHTTDAPFAADKVRYWLPVDLYVGGAEHAVMHLLYARFWAKVMYDAGLVEFREPFAILRNQGIVLAADGSKMSKSRGNVITPDAVVEKYGADALRGYELFMAPFDQSVAWSDEGISGVYRFLNRLWTLVHETLLEAAPVAPTNDTDGRAERDLQRWTHKTIRKVTDDIEGFRFNTMLAALMEFNNYLLSVKDTAIVRTPAWREAVETMLLLLAPTVPHIAEELWALMGKPYSIHQQPWPQWESALAADEMVTIVVQVNGKLRDRLSVPAGTSQQELQSLALNSEKVARFTQGKQIASIVHAPGKLVNIVTQ